MGRVVSKGASRALRQALFPNGFAGEVMRLIAESWSQFGFSKAVRREEPITALFADFLIKEYERVGLPWFIIPELPITDKKTGEQEGRTDLNFFHRGIPGQSQFFTVECKRLHVSPPSGFKGLVSEYLSAGLMRFVDERYSVGQPCGGMLGYVLDDDTKTAFESIQTRILERPAELLLTEGSGWRTPSSVIDDEEFSADSKHLRLTSGELTIHHLIVGISTT